MLLLKRQLYLARAPTVCQQPVKVLVQKIREDLPLLAPYKLGSNGGDPKPIDGRSNGFAHFSIALPVVSPGNLLIAHRLQNGRRDGRTGRFHVLSVVALAVTALELLPAAAWALGIPGSFH